MEPFWTFVPLLLGIIALAYVVTANLLRLWLKHHIKMALLETFQDHPAQFESVEHLHALLRAPGSGLQRRLLVDYVIVGVTLAAIGTGSALVAWCFGDRDWMTGAYLGGIMSVAVGLILTLLGLIVRYLERVPIEAPRKGVSRR